MRNQKDVMLEELKLLKEATKLIIRDCHPECFFNIVNSIDKEMVFLKTLSQDIHYSNCEWHTNPKICTCYKLN